MKTPFKILSFIFFISLLLLISPLHIRAGEEASAQTKDIKIYDEKKVINVSIEDIKERLFKGEPVHFVKDQEKEKRMIESRLITEALKKVYGIESIYIKNAIITGDLDFHIEENLVGIEESGIEVDEIKIKKLKDSLIEIDKVYLVSPSINIVSCQLQGNLKACYYDNLKSIVIFKSSVNFSNSEFIENASFSSASFNGEADFVSASFNGGAYFESSTFKERAIFNKVTFSKIVDLRLARYLELQISWSQFKEGQLDNLWLPEEEKDIVSWQGVYLRLIKNFKNIGDTKSADAAYYHYRYKKYMFCSNLWEKTKWWFGYLFMGLTCGYGVISWRTIATAGILIISFTLAYFFKIDSLEYKREEQTRASGNQVNHSFLHCLYFSVVTFTTLGYGDFRPIGKFRYVAMTEGIFGCDRDF